MKLKERTRGIEVPTINIPVKFGDEEEKIAFPQLTIGDFADIKREINNDMWELLLDVASGASDDALKGKSKKQKDETRRQAGMDMFRKIGHDTQFALFKHSLKRIDPELDDEDVDRIISYGIQDQALYSRALMFFIYGVSIEDLEQVGDDNPLEEGEDKAPINSDSGEER